MPRTSARKTEDGSESSDAAPHPLLFLQQPPNLTISKENSGLQGLKPPLAKTPVPGEVLALYVQGESQGE